MKPLLPLILMFGSVASAQPPDGSVNIHKDWKIVTPWDHSIPTKRFRAPQELIDLAEEMRNWWFVTDNVDRPFTIDFSIVLVDARHPERKSSWQILETSRLVRQPLAGGTTRYNVELNTRDVSQYRAFLPAEYDKDGKQTRFATYVVLADFLTRDRIEFLPAHGNINTFGFGKGQALKIDGSLRTYLGNDAKGPTLKVNPDGTVGVGAKAIVEKNGKKYLRVEGGKLGIPLENLE